MKVTLSTSGGTTNLSGTVTVTATPSPAPKATSCRFYINNALAATDSTQPYSFSFNTTLVQDGTHVLKADVTYDKNMVESVKLTVTVKNQVAPPPPPPPPPPTQAPPVLVTAPVITGTATEGQILTISDGTWTNSPTSFTHHWDRCDAAGANCVDIPSATNKTYQLTAADVGAKMRCYTTAFNSVGASQYVLSDATAVVTALAPSVPVNTIAPVVSGSPIEGQTLSVSKGAWSNSPTEFSHWWDRCTDGTTGSCSDIPNMGDPDPVPVSAFTNYTLTASDVGKRMRAWTTAKNATGNSTPILSAATAVVTASSSPPPPPPPPPTGLALDQFSDFENHSWTQIFVNRYQEGWTNLNQTGTPWDNGGGIFAYNDPVYGGGFKFKVNANMIQPNATGKCAFIADIDHLTPTNAGNLGITQDWSGYFMFPDATNNGWATGWAGVLWEWHTASMSGNNIDIVPSHQSPAGHLRFNAYDRGTEWYTYYPDPNPIVYDHWYKWRIQIKWSYSSDGFVKCWLDDALLGSHTGPTLKNGEVPYLQFGFYSNSQLTNECWHAGIRLA